MVWFRLDVFPTWHRVTSTTPIRRLSPITLHSRDRQAPTRLTPNEIRLIPSCMIVIARLVDSFFYHAPPFVVFIFIYFQAEARGRRRGSSSSNHVNGAHGAGIAAGTSGVATIEMRTTTTTVSVTNAQENTGIAPVPFHIPLTGPVLRVASRVDVSTQTNLTVNVIGFTRDGTGEVIRVLSNPSLSNPNHPNPSVNDYQYAPAPDPNSDN